MFGRPKRCERMHSLLLMCLLYVIVGLANCPMVWHATEGAHRLLYTLSVMNIVGIDANEIRTKRKRLTLREWESSLRPTYDEGSWAG